MPACANTSTDAPTDAQLFGRMVAIARMETDRPLTQALGLSRAQLAALVGRYAPALAPLVNGLPADAGPGEDALEEPDVRDLLCEHGARGTDEERWLAAIIARRSLAPNHLWQDMGFADRGELNTLLRRHFPALVAKNSADMKWKKFIYRELCRRDGLLLCKAPTCDACTDVLLCFGGEDGAALVGITDRGEAGIHSHR